MYKSKRKMLNSKKRSYRKSKSTLRRKSKRLVLKNQAGSGSGCCGKCGKLLRKKRNIGPKPLGASR